MILNFCTKLFFKRERCTFLRFLKIKKYKINIGLMGFDKSLVKSKLDIPFYYQEAGESLKEIILIINTFLDEIKIERSKIAGIGVSVAGRINVRTGEILTIYHFSDAPVKAILEKELGMPVYLDNDSRTIAYGEFHFGNRKQDKEVLVMNLDYGMAIGIFVEGKPVYGVSGYAGGIKWNLHRRRKRKVGAVRCERVDGARRIDAARGHGRGAGAISRDLNVYACGQRARGNRDARAVESADGAAGGSDPARRGIDGE